MPLELSGVPNSIVIGTPYQARVTNNTGGPKDWSLSATPAGLTISPSGGRQLGDTANAPVTITTLISAQFVITLSGGLGVDIRGSPAMTIAIPAAVQIYNDVAEDLRVLDL